VPTDLIHALALVKSLSALAERILLQAAGDDELRAHLRTLANAVLVATEPPPPARHEPVEERLEPLPPVEEPAARAPAPEPHSPLPAEPLPRLTLGQSVGPAPPSTIEYPSHWRPEAQPDVELIAKRCRVKAEGSRWAAERRRRLSRGEDCADGDRRIIAQAKELTDCYLWMCRPEAPTPDLAQWEQVAVCFELLSECMDLVHTVLGDRANLEGFIAGVLDLGAEGQSALRIAVATIGGPQDNDQLQTYRWLRDFAGRERYYIERYMRMDDPGDPANSADLRQRIQTMRRRIDGIRFRDKHQQQHLKAIEYHSKKIHAATATDHDWKKIITMVDELVQGGLPPSNTQLRELLAPVLDDLPDLDEAAFPKNFQLVLREIDRSLAHAAAAPVAETTSNRELSAEVLRAREMLAGKAVVLIGGVERPPARDALRRAFGLSELIWVETREHESLDIFAPHIARPDVALVLLAIRWSSHSYGEARRFCDEYDKPLVRLPAGYNPNQVAIQVLSQCSDRLVQRAALSHGA
jgi:hypothetical protein